MTAKLRMYLTETLCILITEMKKTMKDLTDDYEKHHLVTLHELIPVVYKMKSCVKRKSFNLMKCQIFILLLMNILPVFLSLSSFMSSRHF